MSSRISSSQWQKFEIHSNKNEGDCIKSPENVESKENTTKRVPTKSDLVVMNMKGNSFKGDAEKREQYIKDFLQKLLPALVLGSDPGKLNGILSSVKGASYEVKSSKIACIAWESTKLKLIPYDFKIYNNCEAALLKNEKNKELVLVMCYHGDRHCLPQAILNSFFIAQNLVTACGASYAIVGGDFNHNMEGFWSSWMPDRDESFIYNANGYVGEPVCKEHRCDYIYNKDVSFIVRPPVWSWDFWNWNYKWTVIPNKVSFYNTEFRFEATDFENKRVIDHTTWISQENVL